MLRADNRPRYLLFRARSRKLHRPPFLHLHCSHITTTHPRGPHSKLSCLFQIRWDHPGSAQSASTIPPPCWCLMTARSLISLRRPLLAVSALHYHRQSSSWKLILNSQSLMSHKSQHSCLYHRRNGRCFLCLVIPRHSFLQLGPHRLRPPHRPSSPHLVRFHRRHPLQTSCPLQHHLVLGHLPPAPHPVLLQYPLHQ